MALHAIASALLVASAIEGRATAVAPDVDPTEAVSLLQVRWRGAAAARQQPDSRLVMTLRMEDSFVYTPKESTRPPAGDVATWQGQLYDDGGDLLGQGHGYCVVVDGTTRLQECVSFLELPNGQITARGPWDGPWDGTEGTLTVTGGSGQYRGAAGELAMGHGDNPLGILVNISQASTQRPCCTGVDFSNGAQQPLALVHAGAQHHKYGPGDVSRWDLPLEEVPAGSFLGWCVRLVGDSAECLPMWLLGAQDILVGQGSSGKTDVVVTGGAGAYRMAKGSGRAWLTLGSSSFDLLMPAPDTAVPETVTFFEPAAAEANVYAPGPSASPLMMTWSNRVYDAIPGESEVGENHGYCVFVTGRGALWGCVWTFRLQGGQLAAHGPWNSSAAGNLTAAIVGGTGIYEGAAGEMERQPLPDGGGYAYRISVTGVSSTLEAAAAA